jgi:hypothetical protein
VPVIYEVKWVGRFSSSQLLRGNKIIVTARALAAVALSPHDGAAIKGRAISESSIAFEGIVWKDVFVDV